jgi:transposase
MTRRGRKRRLVLEDEYWKLIVDGMPTVEACRQIGIGRKTGYRWRADQQAAGQRKCEVPANGRLQWVSAVTTPVLRAATMRP